MAAGCSSGAIRNTSQLCCLVFQLERELVPVTAFVPAGKQQLHPGCWPEEMLHLCFAFAKIVDPNSWKQNWKCLHFFCEQWFHWSVKMLSVTAWLKHLLWICTKLFNAINHCEFLPLSGSDLWWYKFSVVLSVFLGRSLGKRSLYFIIEFSYTVGIQVFSYSRVHEISVLKGSLQ